MFGLGISLGELGGLPASDAGSPAESDCIPTVPPVTPVCIMNYTRIFAHRCSRWFRLHNESRTNSLFHVVVTCGLWCDAFLKNHAYRKTAMAMPVAVMRTLALQDPSDDVERGNDLFCHPASVRHIVNARLRSCKSVS